MEKWPTIASIGYIIYALLFLFFTALQLFPLFYAFSTGRSPDTGISPYIPLVAFILVCLIYTCVLVALAILMLKRIERKLSLILAGITCLGIPFGTILGVFTIYTLTRPAVAAQYPD